MEKSKEKDKQILISADLFAKFERMAGSYGLTKKALLEAMIFYFKATQADPRDPKADNPTDALKALDKRLVSFIRQQENELLRPMSDDLKLLLQLISQDLPKTLRQSQIKTIGGAFKPEFQTERFRAVYEDLMKKTS
ncbi:BfmA/BtgA family mobilization protein [Spirosoma sp. KNUC1025]|uniref:BfmA/BtgA family mobilization protein n=1 Tax=Spirosoma sp. KNUC1025 TaxID=2894082 RepID=UPI001E470709|nr:BfmA/BtgA family mobilization protein [Spirosoma sp. KNUC1025]UFH57515.1 hypothetical protein LN737_30905 [Spirosoma sp. KNUC1025]